MHDLVLKHLLKNAFDFQGKANAKVVLGAVLKEKPELKKDVPGLLKEIEKQREEVEKFSAEEIKNKLEKIAPELLNTKEEMPIEGLKPLVNAQKGKVVLRIAPSPSGPLHIGHAYGVLINDEYTRMYDGKLLLRIEDTNPENIYPPAYELIERDAGWLTDNHISQVIVQSDRLGIYYDYAEKLVQSGKAYLCTCDADAWREEKNAGKACICRDLSIKEHQLRYAKMFNGYAEGEAVLRLKTDIQDKNPAMRDFGIMRIVEHVHPKTGKEQRVWPLMLFAVAIDDHELGITHVLNGKDHADNAIKEKMIMNCFGWKPPEYQHWGRINFEGFTLSTTQTRLAIEQKEYHGWDDIRIPFLPALRRRGYQPGAFRQFAREMGLSLTDKHVSWEEFWKMINAFNRDIIEKEANRYFFVEKPIKIKINGMSQKTVELPLHPDFPERGKRTFVVGEDFFIAGDDLRSLAEGYVHRLMDCCNFMVEGEKFRSLSGGYEEYKNAADKGKIIHWLPASSDAATSKSQRGWLPSVSEGNLQVKRIAERGWLSASSDKAKNTVPVEVLMEKGHMLTGFGEEALLDLPEGSIIQLERQFFVRLDRKEKGKVYFWYLHR